MLQYFVALMGLWTCAQGDQVKPKLAGPLLGHEVVRISADSPQGIQEFSFIPAIGAATLSMDATIGKEVIQVFPLRSDFELERGLAQDPNFAFKRFNVPLFPNTNRLLPDDASTPHKLHDEFSATVEGIRVKMKLNNQADAPGAIPHHLHGLTFSQDFSKDVSYSKSPGVVKAQVNKQNFFGGYWVGEARVQIEQSIEKGSFIYRMHAKNTGKVPIPVGFGTHPYFNIPGGDPTKVKLVIPSTQYAEIDNLQNVLPTGRLLPTKGSALNFNADGDAKIAGRLLDNYFLLDTPVRSVELRDLAKSVKYRMTALTDNIVGVQIFYPEKGNIIAIEMVTHHPDPRQALWGKVPTGMKVLQPGESADYGYQIEVLPL